MISKKEALAILDLVNFPGDEANNKVLVFARLPKSERLKIIRESSSSEDVSLAAAIELQRLWRGSCVRCAILAGLHPYLSTEVVYSQFKSSEHRLLDVATPPRSKSSSPIKKSSSKSLAKSPVASSSKIVVSQKSASKVRFKGAAARERLQKYYNNYRDSATKKGHKQILTFEHFCANYIQNWWHQLRRKRSLSSVNKTYSSKKSVTISPPSPESFSPKPIVPVAPVIYYTKKKKKRVGPLEPKDAAVIIQRAWRRHIDVQVYRYYRDLINFRRRGDPSMMLKCINPKEAALLDAAAGIHIKFRLAGDRFPPNIYYKIYTHHNIVDMCANSPKDYTKPSTKRAAARDVHNKTKTQVLSKNKEGWYKRFENNGWRLVSDRLLVGADQDPVSWESSRVTKEFHHSKLKRKEDVERKKRKKKVEWLKKMYREGMLKSKSGDADTASMVEGAAAGMVSVLDNKGLLAVDECEVDELLEWTTGLNFEDYWTGWKHIGTSGASEDATDSRIKITTSKQDPYEITFSADLMLAGPSPQQGRPIDKFQIVVPNPSISSPAN
ncbi:uncharacterized protein LOC117120146 [Anneissia japonica]|uniref:uncharacterized protein LOC117120146 n=1 Tax=Anneissia japonica TaxID=1529436 RepID=UPI00142552E3|nr:uncharacterized protein LOC117120146 [Anneissia japonica]